MDPNVKEYLAEIGMEDVEGVARQLMKHGDREAWLIGKSLCP